MTTCETFTIQEGDTSPGIQYTLSPAVDITGATVVFSMRGRHAASNKVDRQSATISQASPGIVQYAFQAADTDTPGYYWGEFEVTYGDGRIETFPSGNLGIFINITRDL